ncbi:MAG: hypothetical protein ACYDBQ_12520, partial [Thermoplasmatota archaeon]
FLLADGFLRLHQVLRRAGRLHPGQTLMVQGMWFAIKLTNLKGALKCLLGFRSPFVRTPKDPLHRLGIPRAFFRAIRINKFETLFGLTLVVVAAANVRLALRQPGVAISLLPAWLLLYASFFLCAPLYAYLAYRTLPKPGATKGPARALTPDAGPLSVRRGQAAR